MVTMHQTTQLLNAAVTSLEDPLNAINTSRKEYNKNIINTFGREHCSLALKNKLIFQLPRKYDITRTQLIIFKVPIHHRISRHS